MKHKYITAMALCLSLSASMCACQASEPEKAQAPVAGTASSEETSADGTTSEETTAEETTTETTASAEERNKAYIDYVKKNSDSICIQAFPDEQGSIAPYDFNGDGTEDLLIDMTDEDCQQLFRLITYVNGEVKVLGDFPYFSEYYDDAKAQDLAVFTLKDGNKIAVFYNNDNINMSRSLSIYSPDGNGKYISELKTSTVEENGKRTYKINDQESDKDSLEAEEAKIKGNVGDLIFMDHKDKGEFVDPAIKAEISSLEAKALDRGSFYQYAGMQTVKTVKGEDIEGFEKGLDLTFASGAGAWSTQMTLFPDGDFTGYYHDTDMGDQGEGYPNGTVYYCSFSGSFSDFEFVNDYTVKAKLELKLAEEPKKEKIEDGIRYISSEAYGLENTDYVLFYLKGAKKADLPEDFVSWAWRWSPDGSPDTLQSIGMFNEKEGEGWIS